MHKKNSKKISHRKLLLNNMLLQLISNRYIKTTLSRAKILKSFFEKNVSNIHKNKNNIVQFICLRLGSNSKKSFLKLEKYIYSIIYNRVRIIKVKYRLGDHAPIALIRLS